MHGLVSLSGIFARIGWDMNESTMGYVSITPIYQSREYTISSHLSSVLRNLHTSLSHTFTSNYDHGNAADNG
jgi:hypothetical protein